MRENKQFRKLNMPTLRVRRFRLCVGSHIIHFNQPLHLARTRGRRDGEHERAAVVHAEENKRPLPERTLSTAGLHHRSKKYGSYSHHSPSIVHDAQSDEIMRMPSARLVRALGSTVVIL